MAKLVFAMNVSLDGFVDHDRFGPDPVLFRHFVEDVRGLAGSLYGARMYEVMRYWDDDDPVWSPDERDFADAWRRQRKWVVSGRLKSVGPNAELVEGDLAAAVRAIKAGHEGRIEIAGPQLAAALGEAGLIDEYQLYVHPVVLGHGKPYFAKPRPRLRLVAHEQIGEETVRLRYAPG
jgi:dihydrofolate reductase